MGRNKPKNNDHNTNGDEFGEKTLVQKFQHYIMYKDFFIYKVYKMSETQPQVDLSGVDLSGVAVDVSGVPQETPKVPMKEMLLADIITEYLGLEKKEIELSPKVILMIQRLLQHDKENLGKIETLFNKIMEDKKVNAKDIPELIEIIKELYAFFKQLFLRKISAEDCSTILKLVIHLLVTYILNEDAETKELLLKEVNDVLDIVIVSCAGLIDFKESVPKGLLKTFFVCV